ncbi:MAG: nucleotidyltransferase domain-containing protein [Bacteroidia bacterium]
MSEYLYVRAFAKQHSKTWNNIFNAEEITGEFVQKIENIFSENSVSFFSSDVDLIVFGSIARNECSKSSDVDWTILIDGQANHDHYEFSHIIKNKLEDLKLQEPGTTGMFGQITFSHDLIHYIGGEDDTNHNLSRRLLLLLESANIIFKSDTERNGTAYDRVIRGIINQYISHDSGFSSGRKAIPRFLLNDFIRFWRTMCVDFAYKQKEQRGEKWALRNIKLRMSRKLIFIKGLLMCFSCYDNSNININSIREHLRELSIMKPLDVIIKVLTENNIADEDIADIFEYYDQFMGLLNDENARNHLSKLNMTKVYNDEIFMAAWKISEDFQKALTNVFINKENRLKEFTLKYGIF